MKSDKKLIMFLISLFTFLAASFVIAGVGLYSQACRDSASKNENTESSHEENWKSAYSAFIYNRQDEDSHYSIAYINDDEVPELLIDDECNTEVYTYTGQEVVMVQEYSDWGAHGVENLFYERTGYHSAFGAGDADPEYNICPACFELDPVFDNSLSSYSYYSLSDYAEYYRRNEENISCEEYKAETDWIMESGCINPYDGVNKSEILKILDLETN